MNLVKILGALVTLLVPIYSFASIITVTNGDFEDQSVVLNQVDVAQGPWAYGAAGWTVVGSGGTYAPTSPAIYNAGEADGRVGWSNGGQLWQLTSSIFEAGYKYTLSVDIGNRIGTSFPAGRISIFADIPSNIIASFDLVEPVDGTFETRLVSATEVDFSNFFGQKIGVLLVSDETQINFDNVSVSATPVSTPGTLAIFGLSLILLSLTKRRKN